VNKVKYLGFKRTPQTEKREFLNKIGFGFWCNFKTNKRIYTTFSLIAYTCIFLKI